METQRINEENEKNFINKTTKMKNIILFTAFLFFISIAPKIYAQEEEDDYYCCDEDEITETKDTSECGSFEEWQKAMDAYKLLVSDLNNQLDSINYVIETLKRESFKLDADYTKAENDYYKFLGTDKAGIEKFREKFSVCEKMIALCKDKKSALDIRTKYFNEIEASRVKCLSEFWDRFLIMKKKLQDCEGTQEKIVEEKAGKYVVQKGDCLWKIAAKKEIYGDHRLWPKIWDMNKNGVISAPARIPKIIKNPNLIYPGQVLRIPVLSEAEKKIEQNKMKDIKKKRKKKKEKK